MSKQLKHATLIALLLVTAVIAFLLPSAMPKPADTSKPIDCPYPAQTCPYQVDR